MVLFFCQTILHKTQLFKDCQMTKKCLPSLISSLVLLFQLRIFFCSIHNLRWILFRTKRRTLNNIKQPENRHLMRCNKKSFVYGERETDAACAEKLNILLHLAQVPLLTVLVLLCDVSSCSWEGSRRLNVSTPTRNNSKARYETNDFRTFWSGHKREIYDSKFHYLLKNKYDFQR